MTIAAFEANGGKSMKTAYITAIAIGTSRAKVERARVVLANPDEASAVRKGEKTIHQAAQDVKTRRTLKLSSDAVGVRIKAQECYDGRSGCDRRSTQNPHAPKLAIDQRYG